MNAYLLFYKGCSPLRRILKRTIIFILVVCVFYYIHESVRVSPNSSSSITPSTIGSSVLKATIGSFSPVDKSKSDPSFIFYSHTYKQINNNLNILTKKSCSKTPPAKQY